MTFVKGLKRAETAEEQIERLSMPIPECGCYAWLGHHNHGYAIMTYGPSRQRKMERVTRFLTKAPKGMDVDHLCHSPWCVNPNHLEVVTHQENIRRHGLWKINNRQFCEIHGERLQYEGEVRVCRSCKREYVRQWRQWQRKKQGLPPTLNYRGQRKFQCDKCGSLYEVLATPPDRGPRYGCRSCLLEYKRQLHARTKGKKIPQSNLLI